MIFRRKKDSVSDKKVTKKDKSKTKKDESSSSDSSSALSEFDLLFARCASAASSIALSLKAVQKEADIEEFVYTIEQVSSGIEQASKKYHPSPSFATQLAQFALQLEAYDKNLQHHGKRLGDVFLSARRRPALAQHNNRVYHELKFILEAALPQKELDIAPESGGVTSTRKRSLGQLTSQEAQAFWKKHFLDLELEMVPWDRFLANYSSATGLKLELADEILLKHVLDNDNIGAVTPKELNSFWKAFGPIEKSLQNVKEIYKQKWFHHFLSVEEVIRSLSDQPPGTFLVRFSRSKSDAFALEYVESKGKVRTVLIKNNMPHGVSIAEEHNVEKTFGSIHQLIQHYSDTLKYPFHSDLLHKNWFFGDISLVEAEEMLFGCPSGTFMIRFSDTGRFQYAASYVSKGKDPLSPGYIRHIQIMKVPSGFSMTLPGAENGSNSSTTTDELSPFASVVYPSLPKLIANCRSIFRFNYDPDNVPRVRLAEFIDGPPSSPGKPVEIEGPGTADGVGVKLNLHAQVAAQTLASYPKGSLGWQVVCDQFKIRMLGNRVLFVICDGCGWGPKPREAAIRAAKEIIDQMSDKVVQAKMEDTLDCKHFLLRSFNLAHEAILKGKEDIWLAGTTTLLAGMLLQIHPSAAADPAIPEWALVCASVGDCKCFVWNTISKTAVDVTQGNRRNLRDASDPGGRIGPFIEPHGHPDLRNLAAYFWPLKNEEVVIAASDGIHDNLEPECIALTPSQAFQKLSNHLLQRFRLPSSLPAPQTPSPPSSTVPTD
eukprot:TRINITY_DN3050_c0_g2_i1.p1 TRINITY_DN3050_c0_g2~~TRINITY_DN3050_c0_g2_i1.p1  ORF type:complete len:771 (-),score=115.67 TRINITY_DN3050_c0_g2_i1:4-2316(-)